MRKHIATAVLAASLLAPTSSESAPLLKHWEVVRVIEERRAHVRAIRDLDCHRLAPNRIRCRFIYLSRGREWRCGTVWMRKLEVQTPEPQTPAESPTPIARYVGRFGPCQTKRIAERL